METEYSDRNGLAIYEHPYQRWHAHKRTIQASEQAHKFIWEVEKILESKYLNYLTLSEHKGRVLQVTMRELQTDPELRGAWGRMWLGLNSHAAPQIAVSIATATAAAAAPAETAEVAVAVAAATSIETAQSREPGDKIWILEMFMKQYMLSR